MGSGVRLRHWNFPLFPRFSDLFRGRIISLARFTGNLVIFRVNRPSLLLRCRSVCEDDEGVAVHRLTQKIAGIFGLLFELLANTCRSELDPLVAS